MSVVIPIYNSVASINELCDRLTSSLAAMTKEYEIILVDDGSKDGSIQLIKENCNKNKAIKLIGLAGNFGQQNAIMCGLCHAKGDYIITMDDDLQNPPEEIGKLMLELEKGYDVAYGIPRVKQHSGARNFGSLMANILFNIVCGKPRSIRVSSFRVLKRHVVEKITKETSSFVYISAATLRHTKNIGNITVRHEVRNHGSSNYNMGKLLKLFYNIYINYSGLSIFFLQNNRPQYVIKEMIL
jgi:undecaprenyl-phosphate 4-deoxy-4-formamido-L-arabinose transferase